VPISIITISLGVISFTPAFVGGVNVKTLPAKTAPQVLKPAAAAKASSVS